MQYYVRPNIEIQLNCFNLCIICVFVFLIHSFPVSLLYMILTVAVSKVLYSRLSKFRRHSVYWVISPPLSTKPLLNGLFQKKPKQGGLQIFFFFWTVGFLKKLLEIPDKKFNPQIFYEIVLNPLEIPRPKTKTLGNSTLFFLGHTWKFRFVFNYLLEIPYPQPPCLDFFWNSPICKLCKPLFLDNFPCISLNSYLLQRHVLFENIFCHPRH